MKTLITALIQAVADSATLSAWASVTFGRGVTVKGHHDAREVPIEESACPLVVFRPAEKIATLLENHHLVRAVLYVWDTDEKTEPRTNLDQYEVVDYSDDLADYVRAAILSAEAGLGDVRLIEVTTMYDSAEGVPLQQTVMGFRFEESLGFGGNFQ